MESLEFGYVYKTTNLINGKIYIGQKKGSVLHDYLGSGLLICKAINRYGKNNFRLEILAYASTLEMINGLEKKFIYEYRQVYGKRFLYNISDGGGGGNLGEEVNKRISESCKGRRISEDFKKQLSLKMKGKPKSPEHIKKVADAKRGVKMSPEAIEKNRLCHLGQKCWLKGKKQYSHVVEASRKVHKDTRYMNNGIQNKMVLPDKIEEYIKNGWVYGRRSKA